MGRLLTNVVGFDDAPFPPGHRGDVTIVGCVCARTRLEGVISTRIRRDGANATRRMIEALEGSPFLGHVRAVLLQGIAVGGFNVVDVVTLAETLERPVLVVARREPNLASIERALQRTGRGWERKWRLVQRAGPMEPLRGVWVQRVGLDASSAERLLAATTLHGNLPEALRLAHIIAGGMTTGVSRGRA